MDLQEELFKELNIKPLSRTGQLTEKPKANKGSNMPKIRTFEEGFRHEADLLFLPNDEGFKYLLVVVDIATRNMDAEPLKNKNSQDLIKAMNAIYARKYLKKPKLLTTDAGSEFTNKAFRARMKQIGVVVHTLQTGQHARFAEWANSEIGRALNKVMLDKELKTGTVSRQWKFAVEPLVKLLNKKFERPVRSMEKEFKKPPVCKGDACVLLEIGQPVRIALVIPKDIEGRRLHGGFREGDIRFEDKIRHITNISIRPNQPPMYEVSGLPKRMFTKNQLQVIKDDKFEVEKFIGKRKQKGKIQYLVKWENFPDKDATWQMASILKEDLGKETFNNLVSEFTKSQKSK